MGVITRISCVWGWNTTGRIISPRYTVPYWEALDESLSMSKYRLPPLSKVEKVGIKKRPSHSPF